MSIPVLADCLAALVTWRVVHIPSHSHGLLLLNKAPLGKTRIALSDQLKTSTTRPASVTVPEVPKPAPRIVHGHRGVPFESLVG